MIHHLNRAVCKCGACPDLYYTFGSITAQLFLATCFKDCGMTVETASIELCPVSLADASHEVAEWVARRAHLSPSLHIDIAQYRNHVQIMFPFIAEDLFFNLDLTLMHQGYVTTSTSYEKYRDLRIEGRVPL